jgi:glutamate 5-kinase
MKTIPHNDEIRFGDNDTWLLCGEPDEADLLVVLTDQRVCMTVIRAEC